MWELGQDKRGICPSSFLNIFLPYMLVKVLQLKIARMEARSSFYSWNKVRLRHCKTWDDVPLYNRNRAVPTPGIELSGSEMMYLRMPSMENLLSGLVSDLPRTLNPDDLERICLPLSTSTSFPCCNSTASTIIKMCEMISVKEQVTMYKCGPGHCSGKKPWTLSTREHMLPTIP